MRQRLAPVLALGFLLAARTPLLAQGAAPWCFTGFHPGEVSGTVALPEGDLFCPLIADPKSEHSFASFLRGDFPALRDSVGGTEPFDIGAVGLGDALPLVRFGAGAGDGVQLGISAAIFAQFDLDAPSFDLINADYLVGLPLTTRWSGFSSRLRVYHQSSHLGDEFLLRTSLTRENLSFEAVDLVLSQELGPLRAYAGGEYLFRREPDTLAAKVGHGGLELRVGRLRGARFVAGVDAKSTEQHDWQPAWSARAGIELAHWTERNHPPRLWSLLAEYYDGPSPYGQFFQEQVHWWGVGLHVAL